MVDIAYENRSNLGNYRALAELWCEAWKRFISVSVVFILQNKKQSAVLRNYDNLKEDLNNAGQLAAGDGVSNVLSPRIERLIKSNPTVRAPEAQWLINEMNAFSGDLEDAGADQSPDEHAKAGHIIKGSAEEFIEAAVKGLQNLLSYINPLRYFSKTEKKKLDGIVSSSKFLNELFRLIART